MESLEKVALEGQAIQAKNYNCLKVSDSYKGLVLLNEEVYMGKTSIKYWM